MLQRKKLFISLLILIFLAPGFAALILYKNPHWLGSVTTNRGRFLSPPVALPLEQAATKKWGLILWQPQTCKKICRQELDRLARIRLALGRRLYGVSQYLLVEKDHQPHD